MRKVIVTTIVVLLFAMTIICFLLFGHFEKAISADKAAAMELIQKLQPQFIAGCELSSSMKSVECKEFTAKLDQIKGANEEIIVTDTGDLIGINYVNHVLVILKSKKGLDGKVSFSCSVRPKSASPLGCADN